MSIFSSRRQPPAVELTPAQTHAAINSLAASAISQFTSAIDDLDEAARQHTLHADALQEHITMLTAVRDRSDRDAHEALEVADKIRRLVAPEATP